MSWKPSLLRSRVGVANLVAIDPEINRLGGTIPLVDPIPTPPYDQWGLIRCRPSRITATVQEVTGRAASTSV